MAQKHFTFEDERSFQKAFADYLGKYKGKTSK
jgi:hypothetical protein